MQDITLFGKTYKWNKAECRSGLFLDVSSMEEDDLEELKKIIVLDDKGVTCIEHEEYGWIPLEPHCIECGCRLMMFFGYVNEFADHCNNESDYCVCEEKGDKESVLNELIYIPLD